MSTDTRADLARAQQLYDLGRPAEALEAAGLVLAARPDDAGGLRLAALCQSALGHQEAAVTTGRAAVAADPDSEHGRRILAHIYYKIGDFRAAATIVLEAIRLAPNEWRGHMLLARCLCHFDPRGALVPAERSRELAPTSPETHFTCALVYQALGRTTDARAAYLKVLEINPQHSMAHNNLAVIDRSARRWNKALQGFRRSLSSDPQQGLARRNIEAILLTRLWRLTWLSVIGVEVVDTFSPALGPTGQRILGLAVVLTLVGSTWFSLWPAYRAVGPFARQMLRKDRRALLCESVIGVSIVFITLAAVARLFTITNQYTTVNVVVTVLLWVVASRIRTMTRKSPKTR